MGSLLSGDEARRRGAQNVSDPTNEMGNSSIGGDGSPINAIVNDDLAATEAPAKLDQDQSLFGVIDANSSNQMTNNAAGSHQFSSNNDDDEFSVNLFGQVLYPFRWLTITTLSSWLGPLSSLAMIIGCVMPYVPQYLTIRKNRSCVGFSTFVCLTLLLANILRIAFWFGNPFELPLLVQSIIMILTQILLLELCLRVKRQNSHIVRRNLFSFNPRWFWRWTDLASYLEFLLIISTLLGLAVYFLRDCKPFIETLGYCALVTEAMLGLPQVIENYKNRSCQGMSLSMVLMWLAGDTFKTGYFIAKAVPYQFWLCGILQISIDLLILCQVCLYRHNAPMKKSHTIDDSAWTPSKS